MRFIDMSDLPLPVDWQARAKAALEAVAALEPEARAKAINAQAKIWAELKPVLAKLSHNKCWYCESLNERSDNAVDHFRPKNSVKGSTRFPLSGAHPGYWWLAFDHRNYRFCCTFCNSIRKSAEGTAGGKQDCFPLWDEAQRARSATDDQDKELPILLDPTNPADAGALWFDETGRVSPRPRRPGESDAVYSRWKARAEESIAAYHLNHPDLQEARLRLARDIRWLAKEADKWLDRMDKGEAGAHAEFKEKLRLLARQRQANAQYSTAVHCVLRGLRGSSPAVEVLLELP
jgi:uncharacterized protein (TIGR02646 family)